MDDESVFDPMYGGDDLTYTGTTDTTDAYNNTGAADDFVDYAGNNYGYTKNEDGSSQRFNADGSITYQDPDGQVYTVNPTGTYSTNWGGEAYTYDPKQSGFVDDSGKLIQGGINSSVTGKSLWDKIKSAVSANPLASAVTGAAALKSLYDQYNKQGGYNKPVPKLDMVRQQVQYDDTNRRPGAAGRNYFTDTQYVPKGDAAALAAAQAVAATQAQGLRAAAQQHAAPEVNPWAGKMQMAWNPEPKPETEQVKAMASGGIADAGRYLQGKTDGMADQIPSSIDGKEEAALSHGEFVIPADVVSHLGNGNSDAGAEKLYEMMSRIRKARTGTTKQGKRINPDEFTVGGLAAAYAGGGAVKRFDGLTGSQVVSSTPTTTAAGGIPLDTSKTSTLSPWVGDYVTNALAQGAAAAAQPYQAYQGPLTAGPSSLQQQAFAGISELAQKGYTPSGAPKYSSVSGGNVASTFQKPADYVGGTFQNQFNAPGAYQTGQFTNAYNAPDAYQTGQFTNTFNAPDAYKTGEFKNTFVGPEAYQAGEFKQTDLDTSQVQKYMNPYLDLSLEPQLREARRQADISRMQDAARMSAAGAYGGSRQGILESEGRRNLETRLSDITGTGYNTAYDRALAQFNTSQASGLEAQKAREASRQFGANQAMTAADMMAKYGMSAQQAQEASRQFGAGQAMTAADLMAKYGMTAQQAQEASRQFGATQGTTIADAMAKYGMTAQQAQEASRQFGAGQAMTAADLMAKYGLSAQQAQEASRQFGASFGLTAATTAGQQGLEAARANQMAAIEAGKANQAAALQAAKDAEASRQFSANFGLNSISGLAGLGAVQRGITGEGIAADKAQFEEARNYAYEMPKYQLGLLSGLPIAAQTSTANQDAISGLTSQVGGLASLYKTLSGLGVDTSKP